MAHERNSCRTLVLRKALSCNCHFGTRAGLLSAVSNCEQTRDPELLTIRHEKMMYGANLSREEEERNADTPQL